MGVYLPARLGRVAVAFWEALLPDDEVPAFREARLALPQRLVEVYDPEKFDDPMLRAAVPWILRLINWIPVLAFWLIWKPLPLTRLRIEDRRRLYAAMENSRLYGIRGLFMIAKVMLGLLFFQDRSTWNEIGYDGEGLKPLPEHLEDPL